MGRHRGEHVAAVERRRHRLQQPRRRREVDGLLDAAEVLRGRHEQPVVGPDEQTVTAPHRDAAARPADAGIDDGDMHPGGRERQRAAQGERPGADGVSRHAVGQIDDTCLGRDPRDDAVAHAHVLVLEAVVGEEGDGGVHRRGEDYERVATRPCPTSARTRTRLPAVCPTMRASPSRSARRIPGPTTTPTRGRRRCPASRRRASRRTRASAPGAGRLRPIEDRSEGVEPLASPDASSEVPPPPVRPRGAVRLPSAGARRPGRRACARRPPGPAPGRPPAGPRS